jgi:alpha-1,3-rhamnosyl/mannosyltransferase
MFELLIRDRYLGQHLSWPANVKLRIVAEQAVSSTLRRLAFEHIGVPMFHIRAHYVLHWQIDEMLSPLVPLLGVTSLAIFHTTPQVLLDESTGDSLVYRFYARFLRRNAARRATIPVTVSAHARGEFAGRYPFAQNRFRVIHHGVDPVMFSRGEGRSESIDEIKSERPYLLSISNRFIWKNYFRLIQAFHRLISEHYSELDLVLVGREKHREEEKRIQDYLDTHTLRARVHLIDYVDHQLLPGIYRSARAYIFPSLRETFGLTLLEAMACGVPVACARCGPLPEIAGNAALYFDPLSLDEMVTAMLEISENTTLRERLSAQGRSRVAHFTWDRAAEQYAELIMEAAAK